MLSISGTYDGLTIKSLNPDIPSTVGSGPGFNNGLDTNGLYIILSNDEYVEIYNRGQPDEFNVGDSFTNTEASVTDYSVCFVSGTLIKTSRGNISVENLAIADLIVTSSGDLRPICWIGHRKVTCQGRSDLLPVRIAAHAFGEGRPARDLYVSPAHAIAVDVLGEVLIPACRLINGTTVTQVDREEVTYWHVELDSHDILLAEGLPAETYLDCGNRRFFANADATDLAAAPDTRPEGPLPFCRPFHEAGPLVDLVRARLQDRAVTLGWRTVEETFAGMHLVADGKIFRPDVEGLTARFVLPADARDLHLVSETSVPAHVVPGSTDNRRLGLPLASLTIDDGLTGARTVALDDPRLGEGFHVVNHGARWTDGSAVLPADLWAGCKSFFFLRVTLAGPALARWIAPGETAGVVDLVEVRHQA
ncbi:MULTISPECIES: Hint domain-containing protein [unclassified Methylobacterium]|uniref:Hint domain-containing protein n=1 Tax=unclassified Methylobacterium TaxID=2615210 RepID=UPI00138F86D6|nr:MULTISPECIES: Hint domain-containing protein [unclassified Methylobacterium]